MKQVLLLDIDGTLTPPRRPLEREMAEALQRLAQPFHVAAGSPIELIHPQFFQPLFSFGFRGRFDAYLSNGSARYRCQLGAECHIELEEEFSFREHLGEGGYATLFRVLEETLASAEFALPPEASVLDNRIVDRGSMVNFCPIGRPRSALTPDAVRARAAFVEFDRTTRYRRRILAHLEDGLADLRAERGLLIMIGGETSFDLCIDGQDKTAPVRRLLDRGVERVRFIGDALYDDGNDSVIMSFVEKWNGASPCPLEPIPVRDWRHTLEVFEARGWLTPREPGG